MYADDLAEKLKERAGQKYQPANGTEGLVFFEEYCFQCVHDDMAAERYCPIIGKTMLHKVDDPEYPNEWQYGKDGQPVCTKFEAE